MAPSADTFKPNLRQADLFRVGDDPAVEELMFGGAIRTGKSQSCARLQVRWALAAPGTTHWAMRKTYRELADATKPIYLEGNGGLPPAIPTALIVDDNASDESVTIRCPGGGYSTIKFRALESRKGITEGIKAKLRNVTLASIFIDQAEEFEGEYDEDAYYELLGRLSDPRGPNKMLLAANPGSKGHFLYKRIVNPESREEWTRYIHVELGDNRENLAPGYWERMERTKLTRPVWYRRFVKGEWGVSAGTRFPIFDHDLHVCDPVPLDRGWEIIETVDYGWANPFCALWHAVDYANRWWVVHEHYEKERSLSWHADRIKEGRLHVAQMMGLDQPVEPSASWWDPSMWARRGDYESIALELMDYGISGSKAQNERRGGWARIENLLEARLDDGLPQLVIFRTCENLIRELPSVRIRVGTGDDIEKENDHAADSLRYGIMSRAFAPVEPAPDEGEMQRERYLKRMVSRLKERTRVATPGGA